MTSLASKLFEERHRTDVPTSTKSRLDALQTEYGVKGETVLMAWDCVQLNKKQGIATQADWPETEDAFQLLKRKLGEMAAKDSVKRDIFSISTVATKFKNTVSPAVRPRAEKRMDTTFQQSTPKRRPQFLTMERMTSVHPMQGENFNADATMMDSNKQEVTITASNDWTERCMESKDRANHKYMHAPLHSITEEFRQRITAFGQRVLETNQIKNPIAKEQEENNAHYEEFCQDFDKVGAAVQGRNVVVCGWVVCEGENEKLALGNCMLEGVNGVRVKLEFPSDQQPQHKHSLFPGQYLVVEGVSTSRTKLLVKQLYYDVPMKAVTSNNAPVTVWTVSGPYTHHSDLAFDLLNALLAQAKAQHPDVLVLLGPFVDCNHPIVASGKPTMALGEDGVEGEHLPVDFTDILSVMLSYITAALNDTKIKVCLVPCTDDVTHNVVAFPQPALELPEETNSPRFVCLPNPAVFSLNNQVTVGVANIDTLFDFQAEGSPFQGYNARENFSRLTAQMLTAKSFYPVVPPAPASFVDLSFTAQFDIQSPLNVLLTPSKLQPFAHEDVASGTVCINPGRALTMKSKITVCKLDIQPASAEGETTASRTKVEFFTVG